MDSKPMEQIECSAEDCGMTASNLYFCLSHGCDILGCGRATNRHSLSHFKGTNHSLCFKLDSLEFWCYDCCKWVGNPSSLPAEREAISKIAHVFLAPERDPFQTLRNAAKWNDRRNLERETLRIDPTDKLFFVSMAFITQWRDFISARAGPPQEINNLPLLLTEQDMASCGGGGCNGGSRRREGLMNPKLIPLRDFQVVSEKSWNLLKGFYGGGPAISQDDIPSDDPEYKLFLEKVENCRNYVVAHNQHEDFAVKSGTRREKELGEIAVYFANAVNGSEDGEGDESEVEEGDDSTGDDEDDDD